MVYLSLFKVTYWWIYLLITVRFSYILYVKDKLQGVFSLRAVFLIASVSEVNTTKVHEDESPVF